MILDIDRRFEEELIPLRKLTESQQNQLAIPHQQHSHNIQSQVPLMNAPTIFHSQPLHHYIPQY